MISRMEIHYRSKAPCSQKPAIFTTGGYRICVKGKEYHFDFEDMQATIAFDGELLHIYSEQRNFERSLFDGYTYEQLDSALKQVGKEDFTEIFYECFADENESEHIDLEPVSITFYDYALHYDYNAIEVDGNRFTNLI